MAVFVGKKQVTKSIGAAATPVPINTPSLRSEFKSKEPWGGGGTPSSTGTAKLASWAKEEAAPSNAATTSTTAASADKGRNWALGDDDEEESDNDAPAPRHQSERSGAPSGDRDWGRDNNDNEDPAENGGRSRGNSDLHRHQSRFNNKVRHSGPLRTVIHILLLHVSNARGRCAISVRTLLIADDAISPCRCQTDAGACRWRSGWESSDRSFLLFVVYLLVCLWRLRGVEAGGCKSSLHVECDVFISVVAILIADCARALPQ
jgi:hypothetical protein